MRRRSSSDNGFTLVELIASIVLMTIAFTAILGGMAMFVKAQREQSVRADLDVKVRTAAESVVTATYAPCAPSYTVGVPTGYTAQVTVTYWKGTMTGNTATDYGTACTVDNGMQNVAVTFTHTSSGASDTVTVGKRNP
jgi:prepilin-type N-terminal cleavage/methylation domain-containing protein